MTAAMSKKPDRPVVLCTLPMEPAGEAMLEDAAQIVVAPAPRHDTLRRLADRADYLVVRTALPADILDHAPRLRGIVRHGTGLDMIPVEAATRKGIPVANVPGANAQAVAEYVVASFFSLARRIGDTNAALRRDGWNRAREISGHAFELSGKVVGIVGLGDIGGRLARTCAEGLGMTVLGFEPDATRFREYVRSVALDDLMGESDFVSVHCPLNAQTRHLIDARRLGLMKKTAFLVNAARGEIVDEDALARALRTGSIAGAVLDVYARQPLPPDHPLLSLTNVLLTPHVAALTTESLKKMSVETARQLLQLIRGEPPTYLVNAEVWPSWPYRRAANGESA